MLTSGKRGSDIKYEFISPILFNGTIVEGKLDIKLSDLHFLDGGSGGLSICDSKFGHILLNRILPKCNNRNKPRKGLSQPSNYTLP